MGTLGRKPDIPARSETPAAIDRRGRAGEAGASLIEFALILPILAAMLLGTITGGLALDRLNSLNNAARESARYGATRPVDGTLNDWLDEVVDVAVVSATGDLDDGVAGRTVCVAYVYPDGSDATDRTARVRLDSSGARSYDAASCFADGRPNDERRVQVRVESQSDLITVFFNRTLTLNGESVARYERAP
jgi:Flp pilus assembly protein TadG